jgi:hypothetical protein
MTERFGDRKWENEIFLSVNFSVKILIPLTS